MGITPPSKPLAREKEVRHILDLHEVPILGCKAMLLAVRGYRRDTMGKVGVNDTSVYDDAIFLVTPTSFLACNANADPSRIGWNSSLKKPFAQLKVGVWPFIKGLHKGQYAALRQPYEEQADSRDLSKVFGVADPRSHGHFTVVRKYTGSDGIERSYDDTGYHAINIHRGGVHGTSSWGCLTLPPDEWLYFQTAVYRSMAELNQPWIPCCLINGPIV